MEVVGVIAGVPGLIQIIQALTRAIRGLSSKDAAPKIAQNLVQSLQTVELILEKGRQERLWDQQHFDQYKGTIELWAKELDSLQHLLQPSNFRTEPRRSLKKFFLMLNDLEKTLNKWSTHLSQIQTELTVIMMDIQQRMTRDILNQTLIARLRDNLRPCNASFIPHKTTGTCDWIWSHSTFSEWIQGSPAAPDSYLKRTICVYGTKGCGKSVLIKSIAQKLAEQGQIALHFSFWLGNENQRKLEDLLRTLVWQLTRFTNDADLEKVCITLDRSGSIDRQVLVEAMHIALSGISQKVYCAIDGIDESTEDWDSNSDGCLSTCLELVNNHTNLHMLLAGRQVSLRTLVKKVGLRLEITEDLIRGDISKLIAVEIHDALQGYTPAIRDEVQNNLQVRSQVMFLWVKLVLKELRRCSSIEDVRKTLKQVPHDLDREYHRLFLQLMSRTKGTRGKPSLLMKRARYILSSILACPEPLTGDDLCYAYATQANLSGVIEDDLITVDGILDACGDFLRVTEGRYHILHASAFEFLTRPKRDWELEDMDISYFQMDIAEAQQSMSLACFKFIKSIDLGYPLTDGLPSSLPLRYPFFSYISAYFPFHLAQALQGNKELRSELSRFMMTHQFCVLVEYIAVTGQNSLQSEALESFFYWSELLMAKGDCLELDRAFNLELDRRERDFGAEDERYQSWLALNFLIPPVTQNHPQRNPRPSKQFPRNRMALEMTRNRISALPRHIRQAQGPITSGLSESFQLLSRVFSTFGDTYTDLLASSAASISVPLLLLASGVARRQGNWPLAEKIAAIAVGKTVGKSDMLESFSLLSLASIRYYYKGDTSETNEAMVRESIRIANRFTTQLHVQLLLVHAYQISVQMLLGQGRKDEADDSIRKFEDLIGRERKNSNSRIWEYGLDHTQIGAASRVGALKVSAIHCFNDGHFAASANFAAQAIEILTASGLEASPKYLQLFAARQNTLYACHKLDECISSCQQLLGYLTNLASRPVVTNARWQTKILLASCLTDQGNGREADQWFREAACEMDLLGPDNGHQNLSWCIHNVMELALMGQYSLCQSVIQRYLSILKIPCSDIEEDLGFGRLKPLVLQLKGIGSIDSNYEELLRCHMLLTREEGLLDARAKAEWLRITLRSTL